MRICFFKYFLYFFYCKGRVRHVHLRTDRDGQSKGIATAEFDSHREAMKCIGKGFLSFPVFLSFFCILCSPRFKA